jgi:hypothetical protein
LEPAPRSTPAAPREIFGPPRGILAWEPDLPGAGRGVAVEAADEPMNPNGRSHVRTVFFPKSSAEIIDNWQVIGLRRTGSDIYRVEDLFVPQKYTFSRDNPAERH